jgi:NADH-quinone oxidoreductase subunit M
VLFGALANEGVAALSDITPREVVVLGLLAAAVLVFGIFPAPLTEMMHATVNDLLQHVARSKL